MAGNYDHTRQGTGRPGGPEKRAINVRVSHVVGKKALLLGWLAVAIAGCGSGGDGTPANAPPTADAGADQVVDERAMATLRGTGTDSDGTIRSYQWEQTAGTRVQLNDAAAATTGFTAPDWADGESRLVFRLTVTDDAGATADDETAVTVNARPTADAGADQTVEAEQRVQLAGRGEDRDGEIASYAWTQVSGPAVELDDATEATAAFDAPAYAEGQSELVFRLTVTDDRESTASDETTVTVAPAEEENGTQTDDPFARWNDLEPEPWWRESAPYSCAEPEKTASPWIDAGLIDLGGRDPLSLIRWFGNGSYLRYGNMGFWGCTPLRKYQDSFHLDPPADPAYYSVGDLEILVDIARVPPEATGWFADDGTRVDLGMTDAVALLNEYVAAYFRRISDGRLRIAFQEGNEYQVPGDGSPSVTENEQFRLVGACRGEDGCEYGAPGGLNRLLLNDVAADTAGQAYNGWARFGLVSVSDGHMETVVHEMGHGWMAWPHSHHEVPWRGEPGDELEPPNPYANFFDVMSQLDLVSFVGWDHELPSTLAINRYAAGWIPPEDVALHLNAGATYTLSARHGSGYQFLVVHSGRRHAFTTLEVLAERPDRFKVKRADVYDPEAPDDRRARRYDGVLVSRYDQSAGTGTQVRFGPALYNKDNADFLVDVGWGRDDYSLMADGESRDIGGGVRASAEKNADGSWDVTLTGGLVAEFERWCTPIWFSGEEYDTGCFLDEAEWE